MSGGANRVSLIEGQRNFAADGASENGLRRFVHPPRPDDRRDPLWRSVDEAVDNLWDPPPDCSWNTYPEDGTTLYYWRPTYWRRVL